VSCLGGREIAFDRTFAGEIVQNLNDQGIEMVQFGQAFLSLAAPTAELERLVISRALWHGGHPVLRWNASNVAVRQDPAGNIKPDKERSRERIDGISAVVNALGRAMAGDSDRKIYDDHRLLTF
jgi:phage terminase large subunit-like protein